MSFVVHWGKLFAQEYANLPLEQQEKVDDFIDLFERHGINGYLREYPGKMVNSWDPVPTSDKQYYHARSNHLWHYHIGLPEYKQRGQAPYMTSRDLLHFSWPHKKNEIVLVCLAPHYVDGKFFMPGIDHLVKL